MNQTSKIIVERICRVLISLIPYVGSPLEQLTFGIKESFDNQKFLQALGEIEKAIKELHAKGLSADKILNDLKASDAFKTGELLLIKEQGMENKKHLTIVDENIKKTNLVIKTISERLSANNESLYILSEKIKALENENSNLYIGLTQLQKIIDGLKNQITPNYKKIKIGFNEAQALKKEVKYFGKASKFALQENIGILLSPYSIAEYAHFPFNLKNESSIFQEYIFLEKGAKFYITTPDISEVLQLYRRYSSGHIYTNSLNGNSDFYASKRISLIAEKLETSTLNIEQIDQDVLANAFKYLLDGTHFPLLSMFESGRERQMQNIYKIITRLLFINQTANEGIISFLYSSESTLQNKITEELCTGNFLNREKISKVIIDNKTLAVALFLKSRPNLKEDILAFHQVFEILNSSFLNEGILFKNDTELKTFERNLQLLLNYITEFKTDLKDSILNPLANIKEQQLIMNNSFLEFYSAYAEIENSIKTAFIKDIKNLSFDE